MSSESEDRDIVISSRENYEKIMDDNETLRTENQSLRTQLAEKEAYLARMEEAVRLLSEASKPYPQPCWLAQELANKKWLTRRDTLLEQLKGGK